MINRPLVYYTFGNEELKEEIEKMYKFLRDNRITVSMLWSYLKEFVKHKLDGAQLYAFIYQSYYDATNPKVKETPAMEVASTSQVTSDNILVRPLEIPKKSPKKSPKKTPNPTIKSFFTSLKPKVVNVIDKAPESSSVALNLEDSALLTQSLETIVHIEESPPESQEIDRQSTGSKSLMDALNSDYYDQSNPPKKICMDTSG